MPSAVVVANRMASLPSSTFIFRIMVAPTWTAESAPTKRVCTSPLASPMRQMARLRVGDSRTLLLVHGFTETWWTFHAGGLWFESAAATTFLIADRPHNAKRVMRSAREADNRRPERGPADGGSARPASGRWR
jgi:hypothetical protein